MIAGILAGLLLGVRGIGVLAVVGPQKEAPPSRADIVTIDGLKAYGPLERPAVRFFHDRHTKAVTKAGGDCTACHIKTEDGLSLKYKRLEDTGKKAVMEVYHENCISCHNDRIAAGEDSGPVTCGQCHTDKRRAVSSRQPFGFDLSLHYRHSKAREKKCGDCHHAYDEKEKKLYYAEGKEGTCRYCHKAQTEENRISMRHASHIDCISCHRETKAKNKFAGPVECGGCHDPISQASIEPVKDIPRMKRNQPDAVLVKTGLEGKEVSGNPSPLMGQVPFNHIGHEQANDTCRVCHHAAMNKCSECHSVTGAQKGDFVTLEQAMHEVKSEQSCIGCHAEKQEKPVCAGCHNFIEQQAAKAELSASCLNCHAQQPEAEAAPTPEEEGMIAKLLLDSRRAVYRTFDESEIPESVKIRKLSDRYEPSDFPHRKIVKKLFENIREDKLAAYFHADEGTLCQGCHHNSPVSKKPPACASCHSKPFDPKNPHRPGLLAAYHRQCIECHDAMGLEKPDTRQCTSCHAEKKR